MGYHLLLRSTFPSDTALSQQDQASFSVFPREYNPPQGSHVTAYPSYAYSFVQDGLLPHLGHGLWDVDCMTSRGSCSSDMNPSVLEIFTNR